VLSEHDQFFQRTGAGLREAKEWLPLERRERAVRSRSASQREATAALI